MWNDGMDRRFILQWSRMLPKEFMVKARWYRVPRSKPHLQLGCLVCWLNHKFCQWLVKMQSVWETGVPCPSVQESTAVSGRREPAQIQNFTINRTSTQQLKDFICLHSFTRNQMHQYKRQIPLLRCLIEPLVRGGVWKCGEVGGGHSWVGFICRPGWVSPQAQPFYSQRFSKSWKSMWIWGRLGLSTGQ